MGLQGFEQRLERLVEGVFAKTFRSGLKPVEIGRRVTRDMDLNRTLGVNGPLAPNHFSIALAPADSEQFETFSEVLTRELAESVRDHARTEGYGFVGPVHVELHVDPSLTQGQFLVASGFQEAPGGAAVGSIFLEDGRRVEIGETPLVVGRMPECDVALSDPNVSRRHAEVRRQGTGFVVVDLGSTNGTRVNGAQVKERLLNNGDEITVGATKLRFEAS
ncbi:MAG: DUF3662 and FHA domain-containing protein [Acidimicrobiales bacterium]|jgi:hypothetical protein|nr:DUF3662 and FHA domain-containing protein [Acidimicrobiales bacterium]